MKIEKISINNINCLRGEWKISFDEAPFNTSGLFAITGPTGAGKSTILDAITLALFNRIPRFEKQISKDNLEKTGLILTRNEKACLVEVEYSCRSGRYCSKWSISKTRNSTFKNYEMELIDLATNTIIETRTKVPDKNEELIGLSYDQFIKAILLSQGGFAKFLDSTKSERSKLLEDITGLDIYSRLGRKSYEVWKQKYDQIEQKQNLLKHEQSQVLAEDEFIELEKNRNTERDNLQKLEAEKKKFENLILIKNDVLAINQEIHGHREALNKVIQSEGLFKETKEDKLQRHQDLLAYKDDISQHMATRTRIYDLEQLLKNEDLNLKDKKESQEALLLEIQQLVPEVRNINEGNNELSNFRIRVNQLKVLANNAQLAYDGQMQKLKALNEKETIKIFKFNLSDLSNLLVNIKSEILKIEDQIKSFENLGIYKTNVDELVNEAERRKEVLSELKVQVVKYGLFTEQVKNAEKAIEKAESEKPVVDLAALQQEIEQMESGVRLLQEQIGRKALEASKDVKSLRAQLQENQPCAVCGSLHHPYAEQYLDQLADLQNQSQQSQEDLTQKKTLYRNSDTLYTQYKTKVEASKVLIEGMQPQINSLLERIEETKKIAGISDVKSVAVVESMQNEALLHIEKLMEFKTLLEVNENLSEFLHEANLILALREKFIEAEKTLKGVYSGNDVDRDCDSFISRVSQIANEISNSEKTIKAFDEELKDKKDHYVSTSEILESPLSQLGYDSVDTAANNILGLDEGRRLQEEKSSIEKQKASCQELLNNAVKRLEKRVVNDSDDLSLHDCEQRVADLNDQLVAIDVVIRDFDVRIKNYMDRQEVIKKLKDEIVEFQKQNLKWELLKNMIGDATGKNFSNFAQALTLKKLVTLANRQLLKLTDRYQLDVPNENEDDDLTVADICQGNERRSVKTLSGGEKFLVSLSLALGLSDLASRNVKIDSLFIDEGFGTLDPESLDQAVSTLEQLQGESNKMIGIISHVEALKDRIQTQIQLEKGNAGFSSLKVVPTT
jgi:DNA repair protein SbcC/Rad50